MSKVLKNLKPENFKLETIKGNDNSSIFGRNE